MRYFDEISYLFGDSKKDGYPKKIQLLKTGKWNHPSYGGFEITDQDLKEFKDNFDNNVRKIDIFLDVEHMPEKGAVAKMKELLIQGGELWAAVEWTEWGKEVIDQKLFHYISPEFSEEWEDSESGVKYSNVLFGAALTNRPFIKGMEPVLLSEKMKDFTLYQYNKKEGGNMLKDILVALGLKEDATIEAVKGKIAELGKSSVSFKEINKALELKEDAVEADIVLKLSEVIKEAKDLKETKSGTVTLSEAEVKTLKEDAKAGKEAARQLAEDRAGAAVEKALSEGKIVPAQKAWALKEAARDLKAFNEFVASAQKVLSTEETGTEDGKLLKAAEKIDAKIKELREKNSGLSYKDALRKVLSENKDLEKEYEHERRSA